MSTIPHVTQSVRDGALASSAGGGTLTPALLGCAFSGPFTPVLIAGGQLAELSATFGRGPLVQAAAKIVAAGIDCVVLRTASTTAGATGTVTVSNPGSSVITATGAANDTYDIIVAFSYPFTGSVA